MLQDAKSTGIVGEEKPIHCENINTTISQTLHLISIFGRFRFICSQYSLIFVTGLIENRCLDSVVATGNLEYSQFTDGFREACCTGWDV